ncbi:hypothetical protein ACU4GA_09530 [Methylobacterium oryzae CBMB20]
MSSLTIGLGAACCAAGAAAHFLDHTQRKEGLFGLAGFCPAPDRDVPEPLLRALPRGRQPGPGAASAGAPRACPRGQRHPDGGALRPPRP